MTLIDKLIANFSSQYLKDFFFNKIHSFEPDTDVFYNLLEEDSNFEDPVKVGHAELKDSNELLLFTCAYKGELTQRSAKKRQFEIAKKVLSEDFKDGAIFVFYDESGNFRLSFIRRYYGTDQKYSNWKRFTYYVRPDKQNKTFKKQLTNCDFSSLDEIEAAFNVEALSKEFYTELSHWYFASLNEVEFPNEFDDNRHQLNSQAMIRLITRMMFVWFMKQKELIPSKIFDKKYLDGVLKYDDQTGSTYYKAILQNLFFATLNTEMGEKRKWVTSKAYGVQHFYRYQRFFTKEGAEKFINLMQKIPFLNGGLFENLDIVETADKEKDLPKRDIRIDCFSDNPKNENRLKIPDYLFFGTREADLSALLDDQRKSKVQVEGLIDLLNRYDFTIDENSPDDQEVALDPELLGTVFENLLASYNPETQSTARKESGSFYTPRPIVDYMVKESLFYYLQDKSKVEEERLKLLMEANQTDQFNEKEKRTLVQHLTHIKILDPACGSGAFPMGALQQMVRILNMLDPGNTIYKEELQEKLKQELQSTIDQSDFEELKTNIEEVFANQYNDPDYARKLFLIQNCLYGVDIQSIAMQITKLRFFISLLVEQQIDKNQENYGIKPLPNLETKFVVANTLIGLGKQDGELKNVTIQKKEDELAEIREKYFNARTYSTKRKYRVKDKELREEIAQLLISDGWANETAKQIANWDPFNQNASSDWFDPEWMFGTKSFDVVIGNPPYIDSERMINLGMSELRDSLRSKYKSLRGNWDIYIAFFEVGFFFLKQKGILSYITPDKWLNKAFGGELRKNYFKYLQKISRTGRDVFDSVGVDSIITVFQKKNSNSFIVVNYEDNAFVDGSYINKSIIEEPYQLDIIFSSHLEFLLRITQEMDTRLSNYNLVCENACSTSETYELKKYIYNGSYDHSKFKIVNTGTLDKFTSKWGEKEMTYLRDKYSKPVVDKQKFKNNMTKTYYERALSKKLIIKGMTLLDVMIDQHGEFVPGKSTLIIRSLNDEIKNLISLVALLNSPLLEFYLKERYSASSYNTGVTFNRNMINNLPLPKSIHSLFKKSNIIINKKENGEDTTTEEREVDVIVYKLYELNYDEVKIVDPEFWMSEEEYEAFEVNKTDDSLAN